MSQMAKEISEMRATQGSGKLPSQIMINPRENANAIALWSGWQIKDHRSKIDTASLSPSHSGVVPSPITSHPSPKPLAPKITPKVSFQDPVISHILTPFPKMFI